MYIYTYVYLYINFEKVITAEIKVNFPLQEYSFVLFFKDATKIPPNMEILSNLRCPYSEIQ